jgi:hypothetical protein
MNFDAPDRHRPWTDPWRWLLLGLLSATAGGLLSYGGYHSMLFGERSETWPSAPGVIVHSELREHVREGLGRGSRVSYHADIEYTYEVEGETYSGRQISASGGHPRLSEKELVEWFPVGRRVKVYYDPDSADAVLFPGCFNESYSMLFWGTLIFVVGIVVIVLSVRKIMRPPAAPKTSQVVGFSKPVRLNRFQRKFPAPQLLGGARRARRSRRGP